MSGQPDYHASVLGAGVVPASVERRSTLLNDNEVTAPTAPPSNHTATTYKGKFFPRGCRGMLEEVLIYCKRTGSGTMTLRYSPHPCLSKVGELTITPGSAWGWATAAVEEMWNYDSLFIWVYECSADVSYGYDAVLPLDGHESDDSGVTFSDVAERPYIRGVMTGQTPGDIPVSGTVNVIEIPSIGTVQQSESVEVAHATWTLITTLEGAGTLLHAALNFETSEAPTAGDDPPAVGYILRIYADGVSAAWTSNRQLTQSHTATSGRCSIGEFYQASVADPEYDMTSMTSRHPIKFRRTLALYARQTTGGAVDVQGTLYANLIG